MVTTTKNLKAQHNKWLSILRHIAGAVGYKPDLQTLSIPRLNEDGRWGVVRAQGNAEWNACESRSHEGRQYTEDTHVNMSGIVSTVTCHISNTDTVP